MEGDSLDDSELKEALDKLKFDLMPYARTLGDNHYGMPSKRALEKENRKDLIKRVEKLFVRLVDHGGFIRFRAVSETILLLG